MTTDPRIPCPSFEATLKQLVDLVQLYPETPTQLAYRTEDGYPGSLVANALHYLDAPIESAAAGHLPSRIIKEREAGIPGTPRDLARFPLIWNRLFTGHTIHGDRTIYDDRNVWFASAENLGDAEDYLVYALLNHIVSPQSRKEVVYWPDELIRGLKSFRRFLNSKHSGFLVQCSRGDGKGGIIAPRPAHIELWQNVDLLTSKALEDLTNKKDS